MVFYDDPPISFGELISHPIGAKMVIGSVIIIIILILYLYIDYKRGKFP